MSFDNISRKIKFLFDIAALLNFRFEWHGLLYGLLIFGTLNIIILQQSRISNGLFVHICEFRNFFTEHPKTLRDGQFRYSSFLFSADVGLFLFVFFFGLSAQCCVVILRHWGTFGRDRGLPV